MIYQLLCNGFLNAKIGIKSAFTNLMYNFMWINKFFANWYDFFSSSQSSTCYLSSWLFIFY